MRRLAHFLRPVSFKCQLQKCRSRFGSESHRGAGLTPEERARNDSAKSNFQRTRGSRAEAPYPLLQLSMHAALTPNAEERRKRMAARSLSNSKTALRPLHLGQRQSKPACATSPKPGLSSA